MGDRADGTGKATGMMYHCCWPCDCDTQDLIKVDTKTIMAQDGPVKHHFAVIGNPCAHAQMLYERRRDPFGRGDFSLQDSAPDLACADGVLENAVLSDLGHVIIGMFHNVSFPAHHNPDDSTINLADGPAHIAASFQSNCAERAEQGYNSGMGTIFRLAASITPIVQQKLSLETRSAAAAPVTMAVASTMNSAGATLPENISLSVAAFGVFAVSRETSTHSNGVFFAS